MKTQDLDLYDLQFAVRRIPKKLRAQMIANPGKIFVGGGFLRAVVAREDVNDVDVFVTSKQEALNLADALAKATDPNFIPVLDRPKHIYETENALTLFRFSPAIQIIHKWTFEDAESVVQSFDFSCCCAAVGYQDGEWFGVCSEHFYPDVANKRLRYLSPKRIEEAGGSMLRVLKYYQKGYRIPLESLAKVIARCIGPVEFEKIYRNFATDGAREEEVARVVSGLLRQVDPLVDPTHEAHIASLPTAEVDKTN